MMSPSRFQSLVPVFALVASAMALAGCEDKAATAERQAFIKTMTDGAKELCDCKTMECLDKANKKIQDAKNPSTAPTPEEEKQLDEATKKIKDCTPKVTEAITKEATDKAMKELDKEMKAMPSGAPDASGAPAADSAAPAASGAPKAD